MPDFTPNTYKLLLSTLLEQNYSFQPFIDFLRNPESMAVILRHDVDAGKMNSLRTAQLENELGIRGTYYFRMVPESFDKDVIKKIAVLGHEIGYHYEDVSVMAQTAFAKALTVKGHKGTGTKWQKGSADEELLAKIAIESFKENLEKIRKILPVETICMHGSPLSRWDNRLLWKYYDYRDFGIVGEPYFDIDFGKALYLTDTGRRWDGGTVAVRDKVTSREEMRRREGDEEMREEGAKEYRYNTIPPSHYPPLSPSLSNKFHSTFDIINAARVNRLPDQIMLTVHPQRWNDRPLPWIRELIWQNVKNIVKRAIVIKPM